MTDSATFTTHEASDETGEDLGDLDDLLASVKSEPSAQMPGDELLTDSEQEKLLLKESIPSHHKS